MNLQLVRLTIKKATILNAELAIVYSTKGYLDRAKSKLIKAQSKEHSYNLAIVDYAAGYYYQSIGANSIVKKCYKDALYNHSKDFEAMNFYAQYLYQTMMKHKNSLMSLCMLLIIMIWLRRYFCILSVCISRVKKTKRLCIWRELIDLDKITELLS